MKILLFSKYSRTGASSRLRMLQYIPFLEQEGNTVEVANMLDEEYLVRLYNGKGSTIWQFIQYYFCRLIWLFKARKYDVVWLEKEIFPYLPAWAEKALALCGVKIVVDYDDAIFHNYDLSQNPLIQKFLNDKIARVMRYSSCVVAGNNYLAEYASDAGAKKVFVVPTVIDLDRYAVRKSGVGDKLVVGWMGSPSTQKYVLEIKDALISQCKAHGAKIILVGADTKLVNEFQGVDIEVLPWSEDNEVEMIQQMDIGIMPLKDGPWEKGKCGYKLIQYMACAVPVIASPVGVNIDIVNGSKSGLLADTLDGWEQSLGHLLSSAETRESLGISGRLSVENHYSVQVQSSSLMRIMREIAN